MDPLICFAGRILFQIALLVTKAAMITHYPNILSRRFDCPQYVRVDKLFERDDSLTTYKFLKVPPAEEDILPLSHLTVELDTYTLFLADAAHRRLFLQILGEQLHCLPACCV